jgi:transcriptional regulator with XRE-family HTH domain
MVKRTKKPAKLRIYVEEWMENRGLNDAALGRLMGVSATTVWRWRNEQHRLDPEKIAAIADALGLEDARDLFRPPARPGIPDLDVLGDDDYGTIRELARRLAGRGS